MPFNGAQHEYRRPELNAEILQTAFYVVLFGPFEGDCWSLNSTKPRGDCVGDRQVMRVKTSQL